MLIVTALLAIVSAVQIFFLTLADRTARVTAYAAKSAADEARRFADIGEQQIDLAREAAETPLRAYLAIGDIAYTHTGAIHITIINKGKTPAQGIIVKYFRNYSDDGTGYENSGVINSEMQIAPESIDYVIIEDLDVMRLQPLNDEIEVFFDIGIYYDDWFGNRRQCDLTFSIFIPSGRVESRRYKTN